MNPSDHAFPGKSGIRSVLQSPGPVLALAPMQAITDLPFWRLLSRYGGPDVYWTEYFRVHSASRLDRGILRSLVENPTGRPAVAQLIGNDPVALARTARELQKYPVVAIDLNLGCPAPIVYRKCAGGGLLREPDRIDAILGELRQVVTVGFTVKTRLGFADADGFDELLRIFSRHSPDLVTVHGRTVADMYRTEVRYDLIARAVAAMSCPVLANGNVYSADRAAEVLVRTGARGLMIGRGCIRNPWLFDQIRRHLEGGTVERPTGRQVWTYIDELYEATVPSDGFRERLQVEKMKKYLNFIGDGLDPGNRFLHQVRRATTRGDLTEACRIHLDHDRPMELVPAAAVGGVASGCDPGEGGCGHRC